MSSIADGHTSDFEEYIIRILYREIEEFYSNIPNIIEKEDSLSVNLDTIYKKTNRKFVIIIDEWDCIVRNYSDNKELVHKYLQFLHSLFKSEESKSFLALAYITGILPIKKIKDESALNNFREYTMINSEKFTEYFGFTENEVKKLCEKYNMNFETTKKWYDGYCINGIDLSIIRNKNEALTALIHLGYIAYDSDLKMSYIPTMKWVQHFNLL